LRRNYAHHWSELNESSIFTSPIASSLAVPTLPSSVIDSDLARAIIAQYEDDVIEILSELPLDRAADLIGAAPRLAIPA